MIQNGQPAGVPDAADILRSIGEAAYDWRLDSDALVWSPHAATLLGTAPAEIASERSPGRVMRPPPLDAAGRARRGSIPAG